MLTNSRMGLQALRRLMGTAVRQECVLPECLATHLSTSGSTTAATSSMPTRPFSGLASAASPTCTIHPPNPRSIFAAQPRFFSSSLVSTLEDELKYERENRGPSPFTSPPAPFQLIEAPGDTLLMLRREFGDEQVSVVLHVNNQPSAGPEATEGLEAEDEGLNTVVFNTQIAKGSTALLFECETDGTFVAINHISYEPTTGHDSPSKYTGPVFDELDENLQHDFQAYLEERGITPTLGEYLRHLVHDKEEREYIAWLDNVKKFVSGK